MFVLGEHVRHFDEFVRPGRGIGKAPDVVDRRGGPWFTNKAEGRGVTVGWLIDPLLRGEVDFLAIFEEEEGGGL